MRAGIAEWVQRGGRKRRPERNVEEESKTGIGEDLRDFDVGKSELDWMDEWIDNRTYKNIRYIQFHTFSRSQR